MSHNEFNYIVESLGELSPEQLDQLRRELDGEIARAAKQPAVADEELQRRLFVAGLLSEIKPAVRIDTGTERFTPVPIAGEPLSETIIRERR